MGFGAIVEPVLDGLWKSHGSATKGFIMGKNLLFRRYYAINFSTTECL